MLVLASNRPEDLDEAVLDRLDDMLEFGLPQVEQVSSIPRVAWQQGTFPRRGGV